ncbi:MAG: trehalose-phosphatase [Myxococcota bacterium]
MSALSHHERALAARIRRLRRPRLLAFDVDGTLAPIVADPAAARVPPAILNALRSLSAQGTGVALITGRDAPALRRIANLPDVYRGVEHGARILAPGERGRRGEPKHERDRLSTFEDWAEAHAVPYGAELEIKRGSRAIHVRGLQERSPKRAAAILKAAWAVASETGLEARRGRAVLEVAVQLGDKATCLGEIAKLTGANRIFYCGDDVTDIGALRLASQRGVGVFVRSDERPQKPRNVTASVRGPHAIHRILQELAL